jgi:uncharacterized protein YpuA (DUF1002 family)
MTNLKNITAEQIIEQLSEAVNEHRLKPGAKLREDEVSEVYQYFGIKQGDVTELNVTNAEEHKYLSWLVADDMIGSKAISSAYIKLLNDGDGITVSTHNINWVTSDMYHGALLTAGIYDADIIIAAPFDVSGTAGLLGIYKAYEDITGTSLDDLAKQAGLQELFVSGNLADFVGSDNATHLITQLKLILDETENMSDEEVKEQIRLIAEQQNIDISGIDLDQIVALTRTLEGLDVSELQEKLTGFAKTFDSVKKTTKGVKTFFESVEEFFAPVGELLNKFGEWVGSLFR